MAFVTFIHGIANKPEPDRLVRSWIDALGSGAGELDLPSEGVEYQMVYWADVMYAEPAKSDPALESAAAVEEAEDVDMSWLATASPAEKELVNGVARQVEPKMAAAEVAGVVTPAGTNEAVLERIPLPRFVKDRLMKVLLRDVHHYLFNVSHSPRPGTTYKVRDEIRKRFTSLLAKVKDNQRPHVVVSHSMGTVIAYDCLKRVNDCSKVDALMTLGSPLGLDEVQDKLHSENGGPGWTRNDGFPSEHVAQRWSNVYDHFDPVVGFDPQLANDFRRGGKDAVEDINEQNYGRWRHDISHYLEQPKLRQAFRSLLGI